MNVQGANLLSLLSGSEGVSNIQQSLLSGTGDKAGFAEAFMQQLGLLQSAESPDLAAIQAMMEDVKAAGDLQNFAALLGKNLPVANSIANKANPTGQNIDLEDTLQTLATVMQQLQQLDADAQPLPLAPNSEDIGADAGLDAGAIVVNSQDKQFLLSSLDKQAINEQAFDEIDQKQVVMTALQPAATDGAAFANNPVAMPVNLPMDLDDALEQVAENADLSGQLTRTNKPATLLSQEATQQNSLVDPAAKSGERDLKAEQIAVALSEVMDSFDAESSTSAPALADAITEGFARISNAVRSESVPKDTVSTDIDEVALENNPVILPVNQPMDLDDALEQVTDNAELSGLLTDAKKPATLTAQEATQQNSLVDPAAKSDELGLEFGRSINAALARDDANANSQQDKPALDLKAEKTTVSLNDAVDSPDAKPTPAGVAGDIARMSSAVRSESAPTIPANQPTMQKHFGDPGWQQELGDKLIWMNKQSMPSVELRLNPEHLGPVFIKIDVSQDQATVAFTAQHLAVKEAIEAAIPKLREMLGGQQLNLVDVNVSQQQSEQRQSTREFFQMAGEQNQRRSFDAEAQANGAVNEAQNIVDEIEAGRAIASNGLLSLFA